MLRNYITHPKTASAGFHPRPNPHRNRNRNRLHRLATGVVAAFALMSAAAAQAQTHATAMNEVGTGFQVRLIDAKTKLPLAGQKIEFRKVFNQVERLHVLGEKTTGPDGVVHVAGGADVLKVVFYYDGVRGVYGATKKTDSDR